jgi:hypothetical protein
VHAKAAAGPVPLPRLTRQVHQEPTRVLEVIRDVGQDLEDSRLVMFAEPGLAKACDEVLEVLSAFGDVKDELLTGMLESRIGLVAVEARVHRAKELNRGVGGHAKS